MITETFALFTDTDLEDVFDGNLDTVHYTDLSDNPQDFVLYLGSLGSGGGDTDDRQLQAESDPGVDDIIITPTYQLAAWQTGTAYSVGDCIKPTGVNFRMRCTIAGTSHATTEPSWAGMGGIGSIIVDNTVTWKKVSAHHPITEVKLATTSGGLGAAVAGDPLNIGDTILSGTANAQEVHVRVTNVVTTVSTNTTTPEIALAVNGLVEREA